MINNHRSWILIIIKIFIFMWSLILSIGSIITFMTQIRWALIHLWTTVVFNFRSCSLNRWVLYFWIFTCRIWRLAAYFTYHGIWPWHVMLKEKLSKFLTHVIRILASMLLRLDIIWFCLSSNIISKCWSPYAITQLSCLHISLHYTHFLYSSRFEFIVFQLIRFYASILFQSIRSCIKVLFLRMSSWHIEYYIIFCFS